MELFEYIERDKIKLELRNNQNNSNPTPNLIQST